MEQIVSDLNSILELRKLEGRGYGIEIVMRLGIEKQTIEKRG